MVSHLRDRFTCCAPDLIGLRESHSAAADDHSSQGQARAIRATLTQLGVDAYALVGNDAGGWIARELALIDAPRVPGFGAIMRRALTIRALRRSPLVFGGCS